MTVKFYKSRLGGRVYAVLDNGKIVTNIEELKKLLKRARL